jgi:PKD repeat protein
VIDDDVENGNIGWTPQAPWAITAVSSHSPTHSWTDSPGGNYQNYANTSLTSPVLDLTGYTGMTLSFWHTYATESGYDYCYVEYSTNGGSTWTAAATYNGTSAAWTQQTIPLSALDNQPNARIRFQFTSDVSIVYDGWHIDDIQLIGGGSACEPQVPPVAEFSSNSPVMLGEPMVFTNLTSGTPPVDYEWDFGDGSGTSTEENPTYTYQAAGTYVVTLVATNALGSDSVQHEVEVLPSTYSVYLPMVSKGYGPGK